jgi:hypothetical protein
MRLISCSLLAASVAFAQGTPPGLSSDNAVRVREFYRLAAQVQDRVWPHWSQAPDAILLITPDFEYLTHHPTPSDFQPAGKDIAARPRQFEPNLQATFPPFGSTPVMVIGQAENTSSKTSTPWLITLLHEHFHQLQYAQPDYYPGTEKLGLDKSGAGSMWMLNYPFPYENEKIVRQFSALRDRLLSTVLESDPGKFHARATAYVKARKSFLALLAEDDRKYLEFQFWQEGIARYTEIKVAEAAETYRPSAEYAALADFTAFAGMAAKRRQSTLDELKKVALAERKREVAYSFGAAEGLLLDRLRPNWKAAYFIRPFALGPYFED